MTQASKEFIVIEGNIGAGKTTLAKRVCQVLDARLILEAFEDNPFLPKFYEDQSRYAFPLELSFLAARYHQFKKNIQDKDLFHQTTVADYHFLKSLIFAAETLPGDEYKLYRQLFDIIYDMVPMPDLYVYIHRPVAVLLNFIVKRGREYEETIDGNYLKTLQEGYFRFFKEHPSLPVLIIEAGDVDYEQDDSVFQYIIHLLKQDYPAGITHKSLIGL
jgi:deoxyadenosine/deoxycytidine kinase